jgi:hypothetical protein
VANYVLGDEALYAYLVGRHDTLTDPTKKADQAKFQAWAKNHSAQDYHYASRMSVAMLAAGIKRLPPLRRDPAMAQLNSRLVAEFKDSMLEIDAAVLEHWATLASSDEAELKQLSSEQMIEIATAVHTGYTYITRLTDALVVVQKSFTDLQIEDPWR